MAETPRIKKGDERRDAEARRREGGGTLVMLRYSEGSLVVRADDEGSFGVPQHDMVPIRRSDSSWRLGVSAFIAAFDLPLSSMASWRSSLPSVHPHAHRQQQ